MVKVSKIVPEWANIIHHGIEKDKEETYRTLRHIFRSLFVYFNLLEDNFKLNVKRENKILLKRMLDKIFKHDENIFTLILLYHDIGRPFNKEWHALESAKLICENNVFKTILLSSDQEIILRGAIKNHLLPGTIFTGESSYYGASSLFNDVELRNIWQEKKSIELFFKVLNAFTFVDILGYDYSIVYDHYFNYYSKIQENLINVFTRVEFNDELEAHQKLYQMLSEIDQKNLKWRIACALRIFQFIGTQPYLTKEFYFTKLDNSLNSMGSTWNDFVNIIGRNHSIIQFKYALPIMAVLALGQFKREPLNIDDTVKSDIFKFWKICSKIIDSFNFNNKQCISKIPKLWNITFEISRGWFLKGNYINLILSESFFNTLEASVSKYVQETDSYDLNMPIKL